MEKRLSILFHNRILKNSFHNLTGFLIPTIFLVIFTPLLIQLMQEEGFGLWSVAMSILGLMGAFELGLGVSLSKFIAEFNATEDIESLSASFTMGLLINLVVGLFLSLPFYFLAPTFGSFFITEHVTSVEIESVIRIVSIGFIPLTLTNTGYAVPRGLQRFAIPTYLNVTRTLLTYLGAFGVMYLGGTVSHAVISMVIILWGNCFVSMGIAIYMLAKLDFSWTFSIYHLRKILGFMFYTGITNLTGQIFRSVDRLLVGSILGLTAVTYYSVATSIASKFTSLSSVLAQSLMPASSEWISKGKYNLLLRYFWRGSLAITLSNFAVALLVVLLARPFLSWWISPDFASEATYILQVLVIIYATKGCTAVSYHVADGIGKPWINTLGSTVGSLSTILLILYVASTSGLNGVAWANSATLVQIISFVLVPYFLLNIKRQNDFQNNVYVRSG